MSLVLHERVSKEVTRLCACTTADQMTDIVSDLLEDILRHYADRATLRGLDQFSSQIRNDLKSLYPK